METRLLISSIPGCGPLESPDNGFVDLSEGTQVGNLALYFCDSPFDLVGDRVRICQGNGLWNGSDPLCECEDV